MPSQTPFSLAELVREKLVAQQSKLNCMAAPLRAMRTRFVSVIPTARSWCGTMSVRESPP